MRTRALKAGKILALRAGRSLGVYSVFKRSHWRRQRLLILGYHGISQQDEHLWRPNLYMSPEQFASRLQAISQMGCAVLPLDEAILRSQKNSLPPLSVVITFDDGYYNFYSCAYPMLKRLGYPVTVYQTTFYSSWNKPVFNLVSSYLLWKGAGKVIDAALFAGRPGTFDLRTTQGIRSSLADMIKFVNSSFVSAEKRQALVETLAELLGLDYREIADKRLFHLMTKDELSQMIGEGVDIELHTHQHWVPETKGLFMKELSDNRRFLEEAGQTKAVHFTYPSGFYREQCFRWLAEFGIRSATTCDSGLVTSGHNPMCLPRFIDGSLITDVEFDGWLCGASELVPRRRAQVKRPLGDSLYLTEPNPTLNENVVSKSAGRA